MKIIKLQKVDEGRRAIGRVPIWLRLCWNGPTAAFESESTFVSSSITGKITALNLYTPLYGAPEKPSESNR